MDVKEFVGKAMSDKAFMLEVFKHLPDEMVQEGAIPEEYKGQIGKGFGKFCWSGAQAMGVDCTEEELIAECDRQYNALSALAKVGFFPRMIKTLGTAKPKKK